MRHHPTSYPMGDGNYSDFQLPVTRARGSTVDYHNSLLDQTRQHRRSQTQQYHTNPNHSRTSLKQCRLWLPLSNHHKEAAGTPGPRALTPNHHDSGRRSRKTKHEKEHHYSELSLQPHPHLTRKDIEEFEALPAAIRRKYFSTLERLRLAQTSGILDHPNDDDNNDLCAQRHRFRGASFSGAGAGNPLERPITSPSCHQHAFSVDSAFLAKLPAKIREKHLTREEQIIVAKQLRPSVILDAADEAFLKIGRRATRRPTPPPNPPTLSSSGRPSMESLQSDYASPEAQDALHDSFRWLEEDEDLDLTLGLDDYHVNLKESATMPPQEQQRPPSFRRHMSFSKIPFGRPSFSSSRPATKDATTPITSPIFPSPSTYSDNGRRKSRALSLITPRHATHESLSSFDPGAAHYQDPEARLKLRVYLASPQKFDEAIEFGFPSNDRDLPSSRDDFRGPLSADSEKFKTFLEDDQSSTCSEDMSLPDPESPRTPNELEKYTKPLQVPPPAEDYNLSRAPEGYTQVSAASREMTLRMTLTRPDLRACDDQIYGWQQKRSRHTPGRPSQTFGYREDTPISTVHSKDGQKESIDRMFAEIDQELGPHSSTDNNVMKRIWNRVRRS